MKLNKVVAIPALALTAGLGLAACGSQGHAALHAAPAPAKTVVEQKTRTVTKTITLWKTRTVPGPTVTVTAAPAASAATTVTCFPYNGVAYLAQPGAGVVPVSGCTLSIVPVLPMSSGEVQITVTAPDGSVASITAPEG
jgi:hypothetical protein